MKQFFHSSLLLSLALTSCGKVTETKQEITKGANLYENSRRIDAPQSERAGIALLKGCTGYFLKNDKNKNILATARHCFEYNAPKWCEAGQVQDVSSGAQLRCKRVIADDGQHDLVVFEMGAGRRDRSKDFELAAFELTSNMRLEMLGHPGDNYNPQRKLKLTQNCWVVNPNVPNRYDYPEVARDKTFTHNCSTYGGNSGGPLFLEGTRIAVGLPDTYSRTDYSQRPRDYKVAQGILASGFVSDFANELKNAGISIRSTPPTTFPTTTYPVEGNFTGTQSQCEARVIRISYNTNMDSPTMEIDFSNNCSTTGKLTFTCSESLKCKNIQRPLTLQWDGRDRLELEGEIFQRTN